MAETTNYKLNKPAGSDYFNIETFNSNSDIIDGQMKANENAARTANDRAEEARGAADNAKTAADAAQSTANGALSAAQSAQSTADAAASALSSKADLVDGKVPDSQLPALNYDPAGSASSVQNNLNAHAGNTDLHVTAEKQSGWNVAVTTANEAKSAAAAAQSTADGKAPMNHASTGDQYGAATSANYGHVKLSDSTTSTSNQGAGIAATPAAVKAAYDKAVDASGVVDVVSANSYYVNPYKNRVEIKTSQNWTVPAGVTKIGIFLVGGGAGGGEMDKPTLGTSYGGCGGHTLFVKEVTVTSGQSILVTIGAGGTGGIGGNNANPIHPTIGGNTTLLSYTAKGGGVGHGASGGSAGGVYRGSTIHGSVHGMTNGASNWNQIGQGSTMDPFSGIMYAGGGGVGDTGVGGYGGGGNGGFSYSGKIYPENGTANTGGGGGCDTTNSSGVKSGNGGSGIAIIYY